jgi:hypothetical protein
MATIPEKNSEARPELTASTAMIRVRALKDNANLHTARDHESKRQCTRGETAEDSTIALDRVVETLVSDEEVGRANTVGTGVVIGSIMVEIPPITTTLATQLGKVMDNHRRTIRELWQLEAPEVSSDDVDLFMLGSIEQRKKNPTKYFCGE